MPSNTPPYISNLLDIRTFGVVVYDPTIDDPGWARWNAIDASANTWALRKAIATYRSLWFPRGVILYNDTIEMLSNTAWVGEGIGSWPVKMQTGLAKNMAGSILFFEPSGATTYQRPFMSDMQASGGVLANPSSINTNDAYYKLTSFLNADANATTGAGATMKSFTVGVCVLPGTRAQMKNIRVQLSFDGTPTPVGHVRSYDWTTYTYTDSPPTTLGHSGDFGILVDNHFGFSAEDCQYVGYWRMAGICALNTINNNRTQQVFGNQGSEYKNFLRCVMQGQVGYLERGADRVQVLGFGSNYIDVPFTTTHPFDLTQTASQCRVEGGHTASCAYTGLAVVGGNLRLTGVTPDPTTLSLVIGTSTVIPGLFTQAISNTLLRDCEIGAMNHASFNRVTELSGTYRPSTGIEISGRGLRGFALSNVKVPIWDDVGIHAHEIGNFTIDNGTGFESFIATGVSGQGLRWLFSPAANININAPYPTAGTGQVNVDATFNMRFVDWRPLLANVYGYRAQTRFTNSNEVGFFNPAFPRGNVLFHPTSLGIQGAVKKTRGIMDDYGQLTIFYNPGSGDGASFINFRTVAVDGITYVVHGLWDDANSRWTWTGLDHVFYDTSGNRIFRVQPSAITAYQSIVSAPPVVPLVPDNDIGVEDTPFRKVVLQTLVFSQTSDSTGPVIRTGVGAPEASVNGNPGSLFMRYSVGAGIVALFQKMSGNTNTGWSQVFPILPISPTSGVANGSNTAFVFPRLPSLIYVGGIALRQGAGWTWNSGTLTATLTTAPGAGVDIFMI